ncbi:MAG: diguanylate cyclase [Magnetococcales bacterium]|nr:diguanylate cyclase [Magnetococcales bacterium]
MFTGEERSAILIVDDEAANIRALTQAIDPGHEVLFATSGEKALEMVAKRTFDLILLDITMPGLDGFEVCRQIKSSVGPLCGEIPIIFVTASITEEDETRGLELGAVDYIAKPFHSAIVKMRIRNHLKTKKQCDYLAHLSSKDGLTGINNRRLFDEELAREWSRSVRAQSSLSLIMIDIDCFKPYNDHYGHAEGDVCLKRVAETLNSVMVRSTDLLARYGGEEFVCLLPETNCEGARLTGEKMRQAIDKLNIPHAHSITTDHITISVGTFHIHPSRQTTPLELIEKTDQNLYRAKKEGRNRVVSSEFVERS